MTENLRIVAHFLNGKVLKGTAHEFTTDGPSFKLTPQGGGDACEIVLQHLKAVFFVKDLNGNRSRKNIRGFLKMPGSTPQGIKIAVSFKDGEILCGYSYTHSAGSKGFFLFPADTTSNNVRVYVLTAATREIAVGVAAEMLVKSGGRRVSA